MLRNLPDLKKYTLGATDGDVGHIADLFFDDRYWIVRYLVVETGSWLAERKVLVSPFSLGEADWAQQRLPVRLTREQVRNSPDIDTSQPVSRQHEVLYADYYDYPYYWRGAGLWGDGFSLPAMMPPDDVTVASPWATRSQAQKAYARAEGGPAGRRRPAFAQLPRRDRLPCSCHGRPHRTPARHAGG